VFYLWYNKGFELLPGAGIGITKIKKLFFSVVGDALFFLKNPHSVNLYLYKGIYNKYIVFN